MWNEYFEMQFDDPAPFPIVCFAPPAPPIETGKTPWGVQFATQGNYRLIYWPMEGGRQLLVNPDGIGWVVADDGDVPEHVERALCVALGIEHIP